MTNFIAITGKGGVGKTTIAGLIITRLIARGKRPVLAIDADPNSCLHSVLGVTVQKTVGAVREQAREESGKGNLTGISKQEFIELKIAESLVEADNFDLIAMGRPEGPGCYCYANNVLKSVINQISAEYPFVVLDNEAGLENLSRRIVRKVNTMIMVTDPSKWGLTTIERLHQLAREMEIQYDRLVIVINQLKRNELPVAAAALQAKTGAEFILGLPMDESLIQLAEEGGSLAELDGSNGAVRVIDELLGKIV